MGLRELLSQSDLRPGLFILFIAMGAMLYTLVKFASVLASHGIL